MFSYEETNSWHTGPESWRALSYATQSTRRSTRAITAGGVPAGSTTRATSSSYTEDGGMSTASTASTIATASGTGGAPVAGGDSLTFSSTFADTYSSSTGTGGSASGSFTRSVPLTFTTSAVWSAGVSSTTDATGSTAITRSWPSTLTVQITTGTAPATGTTTTRTCQTAVSTAVTESTRISTATGPEYTAADTIVSTSTTTTGSGGTTTRSTSAIRHAYLDLPQTFVYPDASGQFAVLGNAVVAWYAPGVSMDTGIGLFTDFFSSLASGSNVGLVDPITSRISLYSTEWKTWSLSTSAFTGTSTTTGTTSTQTGTQLYTTGRSSLNGASWDSTAAPESSRLFYGSITGSSSYTEPGPFTFTVWTYTREITSYTTGNQFTRLTTTETFNDVYLDTTWHTWQRSFTTSTTVPYPQSTSTLKVISSFSTDSWRLGSATIASDEWQTISSSFSWVEWDGSTNAVMIGVFATTGSSGSGGNVTTSADNQTVTQTWGRTDWSHVRYSPTVRAQSDDEFTRRVRGIQRMMPRGFLGFGDGFAESSPVHAGMTSSLYSGDAEPGFSLPATFLPRCIFRPDASIFVTGDCWTEGNFGWFGISASWLSTTATGPRLTASLVHHWTSSSTGTTGTSTTSTTETRSATYVLGVTNSISGSFFSEVYPWLNTSPRGIGLPDLVFLSTGTAGGPFGGISPISAAALSLTFPPGAVTATWETAVGATSSSSTSGSTGELLLALAAGTNPVAFSYEEALRFSWDAGTGLQLETASVYYLPAHPWYSDFE